MGETRRATRASPTRATTPASAAHAEAANARTAALTWALHPMTIIAVATMAINDQVLKQAFGTWWTGKLSDAAGLVFFPALLAVAIAALTRLARRPASHRNVTLAALAFTALGFTSVKATETGAAAASAVLTAIMGPSTILRDPTDLLTLPALGLAWLIAHRAASTSNPHTLRPAARTAAATVVIPLAVLASAATSRYEPLPAVDAVIYKDSIWIREADAADQGDTSGYWSNPADPRAIVGYNERAWFEALAPAGEPACLSESVCLRPTPGRYGVDVSGDGGVTWEPEFAITDAQWERLAAELAIADPKESVLVTFSVRVGELDGEQVAVAANGRDGIAVRHADGTWERLGFLDGTVVALPQGDPRATSTVAASVFAAILVCSGLAFAILTLAAPHLAARGHRAPSVIATATVLLVPAAALGIGLFRRARLTTAEVSASGPFPNLETFLLIGAFVLAVSLPLLLIKQASDARLASLGLALALGAAGGGILGLAAVGTVWSDQNRELLATVFALGASIVVAAARRARARRGPTPPASD